LARLGEFIERQGPLFSAADRYEELGAKQALEQHYDRTAAQAATMAEMHDRFGMKAPLWTTTPGSPL
jgi:hypothetical protein